MADDTFITDLGAIIAAPILATVDADFQSALKFVNYIQTFGFNKPLGSAAKGPASPSRTSYYGDLKMIRFAFPESSANGTLHTKVIQIPELSLVPLPILEIDKADYEFGVRLLTATEISPPSSLNLLDTSSELPDPNRYRWKAMIAPSHPRSSNELRPDTNPYINANVNAKISVRKSDVPAGISRILALMGSNMMIVNGLLVLNPESVDLVSGGPAMDIALSAFTPDQKPVPNISVRYRSQGLLDLKIDGKPWLAGADALTKDNGKIDFKISAPSHVETDSYDVRFMASIDGSDVDFVLPINVREKT